jgi:hypothetical protein
MVISRLCIAPAACFAMAAVQLYEAAEVQHIQPGFQPTSTGALRGQYELQLGRDHIERKTEVLIWNQPEELRRQRSEIADQLAAAEAEARKPSRQSGPPDSLSLTRRMPSPALMRD